MTYMDKIFTPSNFSGTSYKNIKVKKRLQYNLGCVHNARIKIKFSSITCSRFTFYFLPLTRCKTLGKLLNSMCLSFLICSSGGWEQFLNRQVTIRIHKSIPSM